jgi:chromate transport protein ChrA
MEKTKQEQIEIGIEYFKKSHKIEKQMGTLVLIVMIIVPLLIFPITKIIIGYIVFCLLIYFKFLYDIKQKCSKTISEFQELEKI